MTFIYRFAALDYIYYIFTWTLRYCWPKDNPSEAINIINPKLFKPTETT
jgi:hypothetical protein